MSIARRDLRGAARGIAADLGTAEGCAALVAAEPSVNILVNSVGVFGPRDFFDTPGGEWERFLAVNVMSGVQLSRAYLPGMAVRCWGRVVFMSSESALNIPTDMAHYGVTKAADLALSRGLAERMAGTSTTVNAVLPGPTLSEGVRQTLRAKQERSGKPVEEVAAAFVAAQRPSSMIRRAATVEEVADLVVYVVSPLSSATTGAALRVDGSAVGHDRLSAQGFAPASATTPTLGAGANRARSTRGGGSAASCVGSWTGMEGTRARTAPTLNGRLT